MRCCDDAGWAEIRWAPFGVTGFIDTMRKIGHVPPLRDAAISLPDGRRMAFTEFGHADGFPVIACHGYPGTRTWCWDENATVRSGVRLITPDRPGYGRSDPRPGGTLSDWTGDLEALADALGLDQMSVVGISGGGPYAAACAALMPERLHAVALVSAPGVAKYNWAERPGVEATWDPADRAEFELAKTDPAAAADLAAEHAADRVRHIRENPSAVYADMMTVEGDRWFLDDADRVARFDAHLRDAYAQGIDAVKWGWIDVLLPWGFRLADITVPVTIWRGALDPVVTQEQVDYEAETIPNASVVIWPDVGHFGVAKYWGDILAAVTPR